MSRTLFWYIFRDLLRIFLLTSCALAGIMSFGGLLRPLTEHGLDAGQAATMLSYFMPAMTTYSLPIAALFATTVTYGRLAADNEITAMRSAGIPFFHPTAGGGIALPAVILGFLVAFISLVCLCFIVPIFTLRVEQVIYSNLAQLISNQIERTHYIKFADTTIFAQEAAVAEDDPRHPDEQMVSLGGLMIVSYHKQPSAIPNTLDLQVPREFYLAKQATVYIRRNKGDEYTLEAKLEDPGGAMFPRSFVGGQGTQGGLQTTRYGPFVIDSLIREETKFMDIRRLHELYTDLGKSRKVQEAVQRIVRTAQEIRYLGRIAAALREPGGMFHFDAGSEQYDLISKNKNSLTVRNERLIIANARLKQSRPGKGGDFTWDAAEVELSAKPIGDDSLALEAQMHNVTADTPEGQTKFTGFTRSLVVPMPPNLKALANHDVAFYQTAEGVPKDERTALTREMVRLSNGIQSEIQSRCSFAVSCLFLVIVGCCLGMMFKSGNYLTAFAISVVPALACISLIIAGQHTCENVPWKLENFQNPINLGLGLIWAGPAVVLALAVVLGGRLMRQ
jgi:lipopolysaccharide export LptBFGC system permease protein LptF